MSVVGLSQVIEDFVRSPYGTAYRGQQQPLSWSDSQEGVRGGLRTH